MIARLSTALVLIGLAMLAAGASAQPEPSASPPDPAGERVEREVRAAFDRWTVALTGGDKAAYLDAFWDSPRLVLRVASIEYRGLPAYRRRIEGARMPSGDPADFRNVQAVALGHDAAVLTYTRLASVSMGGDALIFLGTLVFTRTPAGWKIASWHAHPERDFQASGKRSPH